VPVTSSTQPLTLDEMSVLMQTVAAVAAIGTEHGPRGNAGDAGTSGETRRLMCAESHGIADAPATSTRKLAVRASNWV
jgi:hypothetical protein